MSTCPPRPSLLSIRSDSSSSSTSGFTLSSRNVSYTDSLFSLGQSQPSLPSTAPSSPPALPVDKEDRPILDLPPVREISDTRCRLCTSTVTPLPTVPLSSDAELIKGRNFPIVATRDLVSNHLKPLLSSTAQTKGRPLKIVGLLMSDDEGCAQYSKFTAQALSKLEATYELIDLREQRDMSVLQAEIQRLNEDMSVNGLIFYTPCFGLEQDKEIRSWISPRIDVEGFHPSYWSEATRIPPPLLSELDSLAALAESPIYPCTPLAVVRALQLQGTYNHTAPMGSRLAGKVITVVNRSDTVGLPLASMFANESAIVFSIDITSTQLWEVHNISLGPCISSTTLSAENIYSISDMIVSAVPSASFKIPTKSLKPRVIALNLASASSNFESDVKDRAGMIAERVGSVTILMLVLNALALRARWMSQTSDCLCS